MNKPKVVVVIRGGVLTSVYASQEMDVELFDFDEDIDEDLDKLTEGMKEVF